MEKAVRFYKAWIQSQNMSYQTLTILSVWNYLAAISKEDFSTPRFGGRRNVGVRPWVASSSQSTYMAYLLPFFSYLAGSKNISIRPGYDDKYRSSSYNFVEQQKLHEYVWQQVIYPHRMSGTVKHRKLSWFDHCLPSRYTVKNHTAGNRRWLS